MIDTVSLTPSDQPRSAPPFRILFLSNLTASKGVVDAVRIAHGVFEAGIDTVLTIHGATIDLNVQRQAASEAARLGISERISFGGPVYGSAKIRAYQSHDCLILPSYREAMPLVILEALACGLPVMAYDVGGVNAIIDTRSGCQVVPAGAWRDGVRWLAQIAADVAKYRESASLARRRAEQFSSERYAEAVSCWIAAMRGRA